MAWSWSIWPDDSWNLRVQGRSRIARAFPSWYKDPPTRRRTDGRTKGMNPAIYIDLRSIGSKGVAPWHAVEPSLPTHVNWCQMSIVQQIQANCWVHVVWRPNLDGVWRGWGPSDEMVAWGSACRVFAVLIYKGRGSWAWPRHHDALFEWVGLIIASMEPSVITVNDVF